MHHFPSARAATPDIIDPQRALLQRAAARDVTALTELYEHYAPSLLALAHHLLASHADAQDVVHDVFIGLPDALGKYDERGRFLPWLKRVAAHAALNKLRTRERQREIPLVHASAAPARDSSALDSAAIADALAQLPDGLRAVFVLKEIQGFSHTEIASLLDITRGASEVRLHRAVRMLRALLED